jgi:putative ABC transport system permease protein
LTSVELGFALVLAAAAGGLVLFLGLTERRRTFAITTALGATRRQLRGLVAAETVVLTAGGLVAGAAVGWLLSQVLVAVLTGVFDPPPAGLTVPWLYLAAAAAVTVAALTAAAAAALHQGQRPPVAVLREL